MRQKDLKMQSFKYSKKTKFWPIGMLNHKTVEIGTALTLRPVLLQLILDLIFPLIIVSKRDINVIFQFFI